MQFCLIMLKQTIRKIEYSNILEHKKRDLEKPPLNTDYLFTNYISFYFATESPNIF
ncbi:hypothetical protein CLV62_103110 [Dysgonomonas alginatilytica]|uniref:Uncharacterized protein n=1 Tax=Dysgonomonas alginatilytica TaxID=1605892 RepID=A0A2V3PU53_9BACT|nr:hypothetical protein CLV62_103110 [Dysgonomonas alginatilytica]